jgi:hypothetical protein
LFQNGFAFGKKLFLCLESKINIELATSTFQVMGFPNQPLSGYLRTMMIIGHGQGIFLNFFDMNQINDGSTEQNLPLQDPIGLLRNDFPTKNPQLSLRILKRAHHPLPLGTTIERRCWSFNQSLHQF